MATVREFRIGDGESLVEAWRRGAPYDPVTPQRFRDLVLLDPNFDPAGLRVAVDGDRVVGAAYAVRRTVAMVGADLEPGMGWLPFFFVVPEARGRGLGGELLDSALGWLRDQGVTTVEFAGYTPNYIVPGLDAEAYPAGRKLLERKGFRQRYEAVAMDRGLVDYTMPDAVRERIAALTADGWRFGTPSDDDLVDLVILARDHFNPDWGRAIRECVVAGTPTDRIVCAHDPDGALVGWAQHAAYEGAVERFGPFGVLDTRRGTGLGTVLLHLTLERMRAAGAHSAWFLWTGEKSAAGQLYLKTGFTITRRFSVMRASD
ncbi:MAG TPA: GNAT family N-acetyltransferase [Actinocatenispora sp.]